MSFLNVLVTTMHKISYGFGFGMGMALAFNIIPRKTFIINDKSSIINPNVATNSNVAYQTMSSKDVFNFKDIN